MTSIQKVSAVLRAAGFTASKYHRSRQVRGWGDNTQGYRVQKYHGAGGSVRVDHQFSSLSRRGSDEEMMTEREENLAAYETALSVAGLAVKREKFGVGGGESLVVL